MSGEQIMPFPPAWIQAFDETELERLAIMTVDGGMTDDAALMASGLRGRLTLENATLEF